MKLLRLCLLAGIAAMLAMGFTGSALAFHDGAVARCDGCHTMHNTLTGSKMSISGTALTGYAYLLQGSDASSTCLSCHGKGAALDSYHVATDAAGYNGTTLPAQRNPGGDFAWLKVAFAGMSTSTGNFTGTFAAPADESKNRHGHHIVAADYNYLASTDYLNNMGPGGIYPVGGFGCNSCHDPHSALSLGGGALPISTSGSYGVTPVSGTAAGVYRLLGGIGYKIPGVTGTDFIYDPPAAVAPVSYNQSEAINQVRVAYGQGMSEWCANCHNNLYNNQADSTSTHRHVSSNSALLSTLDPAGGNPLIIYNAYVNSGNTTGGTLANSYLSLVPYEMHTADNATLLAAANSNGSNLNGPSGSANVMCLSCHRAHASGFESMARFDLVDFFVTDTAGNFVFTGSDNMVHFDPSGYYKAAYYDRNAATVFGPSQRTLCNKCHAKD